MSSTKNLLDRTFRQEIRKRHPRSEYLCYRETDAGFRVYYRLPEGRVSYLNLSSYGELTCDRNPSFLGGILANGGLKNLGLLLAIIRLILEAWL